MSYSNKESIKEFWDSRAGLGLWAGTNDVIAKEIEMNAIGRYIKDGIHVLEAGCGNGVSAIHFARQFEINIVGTDFSESMIQEASNLLEGQVLKGNLCFKQLDILNLNEVQDQFDLVYTERVIINLSDWYTQRRAIENVFQLLRPGGAFIMCENSQNGLNDINELRLAVGLKPYQAPWHNRYLVDAEIQQIEFPGVTLETIDYYSSTYYLLSRVVNAWMAQQEGEEPKYESPINKLALKLPAIGNLGQGRIWVWRKGL